MYISVDVGGTNTRIAKAKSLTNPQFESFVSRKTGGNAPASGV